MRFLTVLSSLLIGAGVAAAATACLTYFTRYSMFDALYGEIDTSLYLQITQMSSMEKAAILFGIVAVLLGFILAVVRLVTGRRSARS